MAQHIKIQESSPLVRVIYALVEIKAHTHKSIRGRTADRKLRGERKKLTFPVSVSHHVILVLPPVCRDNGVSCLWCIVILKSQTRHLEG